LGKNINDNGLKSSIFVDVNDLWIAGRSPHFNAPACSMKKNVSDENKKSSMSMNNPYFFWLCPSIVWTSSSPGADEDA
jgi:hypothetical protein